MKIILQFSYNYTYTKSENYALNCTIDKVKICNNMYKN